MDSLKFRIICLLMLIFYVSISKGQDCAKAKQHNQTVKLPHCCQNISDYSSGPHTCGKRRMNDPVTLKNYTFNFPHNDENVVLQAEFQFHQCSGDSVIAAEGEQIIEFSPMGSVSFQTNTEKGQISFNDYCIDYYHSMRIMECDNTELSSDTKQSNNSKPSNDNTKPRVVYISCLVFSTLCFIFAVVIHTAILNVETHKKIFIGYCLCMGATFMCLVLFQLVNTNCNYIGSFFLVFILSSFVWIFCLCLDIVYLIRNFTGKENKERLMVYIAGAVAIPLALLLISVVPTGIPDIPKLFVNGQKMCDFHKGDEGKLPLLLFIPIGLLIIASIGSLFYCWYLIRNNDIIFENDIMWLEKCHSFKYVMKSYCLLLLISSIWMIGAILQYEEIRIGMAYEFIEGLQGIFVLAIFVFNRYTRKQIHEALFTKKVTERKSSYFKNIIERFKHDSMYNWR